MDYDNLDVDKIVEEVHTAIDEGRYRKATKRESMEVRIAALHTTVHEMEAEIAKDRELIHA